MRPSQEDVSAEEASTEETAGTAAEEPSAEQKAATRALDKKRKSNIEKEGMTDDGMALEHEEESVIRDSVADITQGVVNKTAAFLYGFIDVFVGICFVVMAFLTIQVAKQHGISYMDLGVTGWISLIATLLGGSILVFNPRRTFNKSIGLYAVIMGITAFNSYWDSLELCKEWDFLFIGDALFIILLVMMALCINLVVSGISYMRGRPRGTLGMMVKAMLMMAIHVLTIVVKLYTKEYSGLLEAIRDDPVTIVQIFLFFVFLNVMDTDEARSYNTKNRLSNSTEALRQTKTLDGRSYIHLRDAVVLNSTTFEGWTRPRDGGPVELEYRFAIHNKGGASYVTVQRWRGKDTYYLTISDHDHGTNIRATRMSVERMYMTDDRVNFRIVGREHFYVNVNIRHPMDEYKVRWRGKE